MTTKLRKIYKNGAAGDRKSEKTKLRLRFIEICSQLWREIETTAQHLGNISAMEAW